MSFDRLSSYAVGDVICAPSGDMIQFDLTDGGAILLLKLSKPTQAEKDAFVSGEKYFGFTVANDIIFFLSKFGSLSWMDAPFARQFSSCTRLEMPEDGFGLAMHAMLVDASNGTLVAQKLIGLPTKLSVDLIHAVMDQPEIPDFNHKLAVANRVYRTKDLVARAEVQKC